MLCLLTAGDFAHATRVMKLKVDILLVCLGIVQRHEVYLHFIANHNDIGSFDKVLGFACFISWEIVGMLNQEAKFVW